MAEHLPFGAGPAEEDWQLLLWHWRRRVLDKTRILDEVADDLRRCLSCSCTESTQCPLPALYTPLPDWGLPLDTQRPDRRA